MAFSDPGEHNTGGVSLCILLWADRILIRLATTGLMVEASCKVHTTVEVLLLPDVGVHHARGC